MNEKRITFVWKMEREARVGAADVTGEDKRRLGHVGSVGKHTAEGTKGDYYSLQIFVHKFYPLNPS